MTIRARVTLAAFVVGVLTVASAFSLSPAVADVAARRLPTKTAEVNGITVEVTPQRLDARGAVVHVKLDTHQGDLGVDLRKKVTLTVNAKKWPFAWYRGDGPGGHHREGMLRFTAKGPAVGKVRLVIKGLGGPVTFTWRLPR